MFRGASSRGTNNAAAFHQVALASASTCDRAHWEVHTVMKLTGKEKANFLLGQGRESGHVVICLMLLSGLQRGTKAFLSVRISVISHGGKLISFVPQKCWGGVPSPLMSGKMG